MSIGVHRIYSRLSKEKTTNLDAKMPDGLADLRYNGEKFKQATILKNQSLAVNATQSPQKIKILFLASNTRDRTPLRLDEEFRAITETIRDSKYRDFMELIPCWAVRTSDLLQALNEHQPHIIHFSGHGSKRDEIILQGSAGETKAVSKEAIKAAICTAENVRVVIFNACFSIRQAESVTQYVDVAIGMNTAISDEAAQVFAAQFYSSIGFGLSIQQAFNQAKVSLMLEGIPEESTPELFTREETLPDGIVLVQPMRFIR